MVGYLYMYRVLYRVLRTILRTILPTPYGVLVAKWVQRLSAYRAEPQISLSFSPTPMSWNAGDVTRERERQRQSMVSREDSDRTDPHAPLLVAADPSLDHDLDDETSAPELSYSGGWSIWILTFSAGISGLLFGYEYATSLPLAP